VDGDKLGRNVLLRLLLVPSLERIIDLVTVTPPPSLETSQRLEILLRLLVLGDGNDKLGRILSSGRDARLFQSLGGAAIESLETNDESSLARRAVGAKAGVLGVREEVGRLDVVGGGPARGETIGSGVSGAGLELGDAVGEVDKRMARRARGKGSGCSSRGHAKRNVLVVVPVWKI
jgi:hypothetical protein